MNNIRLCFRKINRWAQGYVARRTKDTGLTPSQIQALRHIGYHQVMSQQELVEDMGVDKAAVTRLVAGLEELGYDEGWISAEQVQAIGQELSMTLYGKYLLSLK